MGEDHSVSPDYKIMKDWIYFLLGIGVPIIVGQLFKDDFFFAIIITGIALITLFMIAIKNKTSKVIAIIITMVVLIIMGGYFRICCYYPTFEISFIGLPYEDDDTYYLTNSLISTYGDLSEYEDLTLVPIQVEIKPAYSGNANFGNLALRISGPSQTKNYLLWKSFDSSSKTETISLSTADIVSLSEILKTHEKLESNLMVNDFAYPQAELKFEVIRLSDPDRPYKNETRLQIINTPWIQSSSIARRDEFYIDYALKNLGPEATFHCRITISKSGELTIDEHDFWGDAEVFHYGPDCEPFTLKTGETFTTSFPLNKETMGKDFSIGRYLVQIYTFAERNDIQINNNKSYETAISLWLLANNGDILTFIVCNDPGRTCEDSLIFPIEKGDIIAFPYSSVDDNGNGYTYFKINTYQVENRITNRYILDYWLDPSRSGWVGFALDFQSTMDLSTFNAIQFKIKLDERPHRLWFQVSTEDGTYDRVVVGDESGFGEAVAEEQWIVIPFDAFEGVDWTIISDLQFTIDEYMVPDSSHHELQVSELTFIRK